MFKFQASLRLAVMIQSPMYDGMMPLWYHPKCFFSRTRPSTHGEFAHFDALRWEDQVGLSDRRRIVLRLI